MPVASDTFGTAVPHGILPPPAPPRRRSGLIAGVIVVGLVLVAVVGALALNRKGGGFPDSLGGQPRLTTDAAKQLERSFSNTKIQGTTFEAAVYGSGGQPQDILVLIHGLPSQIQQMSGDEFFSGLGSSFAGGFSGPGGGPVDLTSGARATVGGVDHACAAVTGSSGGGVICVFKGKTVGIVILQNYADPQGALSVSEEAAKAVT